MSTLRFGCSSSSRPTSARSSAAQPTWAPTNVVARMPPDEPPERREQLVERREPGRVAPSRSAASARSASPGCASSSSQRSLCRIERLEERDRVGDVDDDRKAQVGGGRPERVEPRVVDVDEAAGGVARPQPEQLPDLEPARSPRGGVPQPSRLGLAEGRVRRPAVVVEPGEDGDAIRDTGPATARSRRRGPRPGRRRGPRPSRCRTRPAWRSARPASESPSRRRTGTRGGCARRRPGTAAAGPRGPARAGTIAAGSRRVGGRPRSVELEDDDLAEVARRIRVAAARQGELEGERMARVEEQRQPRRRVQARRRSGSAHRRSCRHRSRRRRSATSAPRAARPPRRRRPPRPTPAPPTRPTTSMPGLADRDRAVPELERLVGARGHLARLGQLEAPLGGDARTPGRRRGRRSGSSPSLRAGVRPARPRSRRPSRPRSATRSVIRPWSPATRRDDPEQEREHAREGAGHHDRRLVAGRRDERRVRERGERAAAAAGHRDRRMPGGAHPLGDGDGLRRGTGARDDDDRFAPASRRRRSPRRGRPRAAG